MAATRKLEKHLSFVDEKASIAGFYRFKSTAKAIYLDSRGDVLKVAGLFMLGKRCMLATLV